MKSWRHLFQNAVDTMNWLIDAPTQTAAINFPLSINARQPIAHYPGQFENFGQFVVEGEYTINIRKHHLDLGQ